MQFASSNWERHAASLKPLGLNILLNNNCTQPVRVFDDVAYTVQPNTYLVLQEKALIVADHSAHIDKRVQSSELNELQVCVMRRDK